MWTNLEIIGECGSCGVRGSFLPIDAIRLPSPAGEQPLGNSVELATQRRQIQLVGSKMRNHVHFKVAVGRVLGARVGAGNGKCRHQRATPQPAGRVGKALFAWASRARAQTNGDTALKIELGLRVRADTGGAADLPGHPRPSRESPAIPTAILLLHRP
ncbi:unnamed protein product [Chrysodeixis includens]|uniref:Uncharacterized protein n=1 Tax=Chrysodeixis includens TaxID=689277 RepID=A0A9N8KQT9_CHRIL|nr:unnamed protein product [Chrysodeixis includens]